MLISVTARKVSCPSAEVSGIPVFFEIRGEDDVLFREYAGAVLRLVRGRREEERARLDARGHFGKSIGFTSIDIFAAINKHIYLPQV